MMGFHVFEVPIATHSVRLWVSLEVMTTTGTYILRYGVLSTVSRNGSYTIASAVSTAARIEVLIHSQLSGRMLRGKRLARHNLARQRYPKSPLLPCLNVPS